MYVGGLIGTFGVRAILNVVQYPEYGVEMDQMAIVEFFVPK
jgi:DNA-binding transcriptional regulator of glucitol operon